MDQKVKVSSLTQASTVNDNDLMYVVQGGTSKKLPFSVVRGLMTSNDFISSEFDNSDLVNGVLPINHGKGTDDLFIVVKNNDGTRYVPQFGTTDNNNAWIDFGGAGSSITGTWKYWMIYFNGAASVPSTVTEKIIDIGAWNLSSDTIISVPHGLDLSKIISVDAFIYNDSQDTQQSIFGMISEGGAIANGGITRTSVNVILAVPSGAWVTSGSFVNVAINRGKIYIKHYV